MVAMNAGPSSRAVAQPLTVMIVVPDTNTTMEREVRQLWPEITRLVRIGIPRPMRPIVVEDLPAYRQATLDAMSAYTGERPDVVLYGCTTAGFLAGPAADREMQKALSEATGAPAVTTASSMVAALRESGMRRPVIVTPYLEASNRALIAYLEAEGIDVAQLDSMNFTTVAQYNDVSAPEVRAFATVAGSHPHADGLFIACTQLPTAPFLEALGEEMGKPVRGAIEATVWNARRTLGA